MTWIFNFQVTLVSKCSVACLVLPQSTVSVCAEAVCDRPATKLVLIGEFLLNFQTHFLQNFSSHIPTPMLCKVYGVILWKCLDFWYNSRSVGYVHVQGRSQQRRILVGPARHHLSNTYCGEITQNCRQFGQTFGPRGPSMIQTRVFIVKIWL